MTPVFCRACQEYGVAPHPSNLLPSHSPISSSYTGERLCLCRLAFLFAGSQACSLGSPEHPILATSPTFALCLLDCLLAF
mmetsp:Transcript_160402/g.514810  ORF Transcript_160402/g.514810 Transcript_160402/m.514810 type:complete len:80 (+) Transcript_160402:55-294(+)